MNTAPTDLNIDHPEFDQIAEVLDPRPDIDYTVKIGRDGMTTLRRHHPAGCQGVSTTPERAGWTVRPGYPHELAIRYPCKRCILLDEDTPSSPRAQVIDIDDEARARIRARAAARAARLNDSGS
jgi:hypothetical protein